MNLLNTKQKVKITLIPLNTNINICRHDAMQPCSAIIEIHKGIPERQLANVAFDAFHHIFHFDYPTDFHYIFSLGSKKLTRTPTHEPMTLTKYGQIINKSVKHDPSWENFCGEFVYFKTA